MNQAVKNLITSLKQEANPANAVQMAAYMKNNFEFFGISTPKRRAISKVFFKEFQPINTQEIINTSLFLWQSVQRELHYIAIELLKFHRKKFDENIIEIYEQFIITNSWWDSVDSVCSNLLDYYFKKNPHKIKEITGKWNTSENFWLQRNSIMFQKFFNEKTDTELLSKYILSCNGSNEFFIRKAIGWALREYAYTNPNWVRNFVATNELAKLSKREAMKHL
jgi:3-methyladenine DNA glycosylase AlkD